MKNIYKEGTDELLYVRLSRFEEADVFAEIIHKVKARGDSPIVILMLLAEYETKYHYRLLRIRACLDKLNYKFSFPDLDREVGKMKIGIIRYLVACEHESSVFVKWQTKVLKFTNGCLCCMFWNGFAQGAIIGAIGATIIQFLLRKFLS